MRYIDYGSMQHDARRRVLEMQRQAQQAVERTTPEIQHAPSQGQHAPSHAGCGICPAGDSGAESFAAPDAGCHQQSRTPAPWDSEQLLLLAVLVLLLAENADTVLVLALLYLIV